MPVDYQIDDDTPMVRARAHGRVVLSEILTYFDAVTMANAAGYPKLFDARDAEFELTDDDVMVLAARVSAYAAFDPRGPVALVATDVAATNMLRRYMNVGRASRQLKLFPTISDAELWLLNHMASPEPKGAAPFV